MASLNKVFLLGNLTRDPELRRTPKGVSVAHFRIAVSRPYTLETGEQKEEVLYMDVEAWGRQAELVQNRLTKGRPVLVEGRLRMDTWEDRTTKQKRTTYRLVADRVVFIGPPLERAAAAGAEPEPVPAEPESPAEPSVPSAGGEKGDGVPFEGEVEGEGVDTDNLPF